MIEIQNLSFLLDRKYYIKDGSHIWFKEQNGNILIGMDSFLTENAGYLSYLTIENNEFDQGESIGSFESAKFVSKFYSPISGKIVKINDNVVNDPIKINQDPYNSWILEIQPTNLNSDLQSSDILENEDDIRTWIENELKRLEEDVSK
jgi:glycine cleavage system H protein